jgi:hypothetical protein
MPEVVMSSRFRWIPPRVSVGAGLRPALYAPERNTHTLAELIREGEAPAEPLRGCTERLGRSLALPNPRGWLVAHQERVRWRRTTRMVGVGVR